MLILYIKAKQQNTFVAMYLYNCFFKHYAILKSAKIFKFEWISLKKTLFNQPSYVQYEVLYLYIHERKCEIEIQIWKMILFQKKSLFPQKDFFPSTNFSIIFESKYFISTVFFIVFGRRARSSFTGLVCAKIPFERVWKRIA